MKVGDLVQWEWQLQADSWKPTRFTGVILKMVKVSNGTVLHVLDMSGQLARVRTDAMGMEVLNESR